MSRDEVAAFLHNVQLKLDSLQQQLDAGARALPGTAHDALPGLLREQKVALTGAFAEALEEWAHFEQDTGLAEQEQQPPAPGAGGSGDEDEAAVTPFAVQLRSLEVRVAKMGGRPALGACVLPKSTPGQRTALQATASPAAVEILRGRIGSGDADATPLRKTGGGAGGEATHTPLVALRPVAAAPGGGGLPGGTTPGEAHPASELAAALQRRAAAREAQEAAAGAAGASP
eukprot:scaffold1.g5805.t1